MTRVCSLRLIGAAALAFATPASTVPPSDSATIQVTQRDRPNVPPDEDATEYLGGTFTNVYETPLPSALLLLVAGWVVARRAAGSDRRRIRDRAAA